MKKENEITATRKYLETIRQVYKERGLAGAVVHEALSTIFSAGNKATALGDNLFFLPFFAIHDYFNYCDGRKSDGAKWLLNNVRELTKEARDYITNPNLIDEMVKHQYVIKKKIATGV